MLVSKDNHFELHRYLTGPTPAASQDYLTQDELVKSRAALKDEIKRWTHQRNPQVLSTKVFQVSSVLPLYII